MTQALYRKWRPQTFDQIVGQEHVTQTLRNALASGRVGHAYLFAGPRGTGKTTMARLVAKAVNCLADDPAERPCNECLVCQAVTEGRFLDLIEIDAASHTSVDDVRELRDKIGFRPNEGRYKVYIIDEVPGISTMRSCFTCGGIRSANFTTPGTFNASVRSKKYTFNATFLPTSRFAFATASSNTSRSVLGKLKSNFACSQSTCPPVINAL